MRDGLPRGFRTIVRRQSGFVARERSILIDHCLAWQRRERVDRAEVDQPFDARFTACGDDVAHAFDIGGRDAAVVAAGE